MTGGWGRDGARRVAIFGVGRSGTTALYDMLRIALTRGVGADSLSYRYEPYLWRVEAVDRSGDIAAGAFDTNGIDPLGLYAHTTNPLFAVAPPDDRDLPGAAHRRFMDDVIGGDGDGDDWRLIKFVRGSGRIEQWLTAFPALRAVAILRDPYSSMNSVLNHFSFFGDEFHRSDKHRFAQEVKARFDEERPAFATTSLQNDFKWGLYWWFYMNRAMIEAKARHPDRILLIDYATLTRNRQDAADLLCDHIGVARAPAAGGRSVGLLSRARHLSDPMLQQVEPFARWYAKTVTDAAFALSQRANPDWFSKEAFAAKFDAYEPGVVSLTPTARTGVGWRFSNQILTARRQELSASRARLQSALRGFAGALAAPALQTTEATVSVVIPHFRAPRHLDVAVGAVLGQTLRGARAVVVDDASGPDADATLDRLARDARVTVLRNPRNVGPGLTRHRGVLAAQTALISTLDADDAMAPEKLEREIDALYGAQDAVAFSDVEYTHHDIVDRWTMAGYAAMSRRDRLTAMLRRESPPPRDMTLSRALYMRAGGFQTGVRVYEDFCFKLRLAMHCADWRAVDDVGVFYHRDGAGLSGGDAHSHGFHLFYVFLMNAPALLVDLGAKAVTLFVESLSNYPGLEQMRRDITSVFAQQVTQEALMRKIRAQRDLAILLKERADIGMQERVKLLTAIGADA